MSEYVPTMSALTEQVAREHRPYRDPVAPGRLWLCECDGGNVSRDIVAHVHHIAAATERAVHANDARAAEIKAEAWDDGFTCGIAYQAGSDEAWMNPHRFESEAKP